MSFVCNICHEQMVDPVSTTCGHVFCWAELLDWIMRGHETCPVCSRSLIAHSFLHVLAIHENGEDAVGRRLSPRPPFHEALSSRLSDLDRAIELIGRMDETAEYLRRRIDELQASLARARERPGVPRRHSF